MINPTDRHEAGLGLIEAMISMAILAIAALFIGTVLISSFGQTDSAENVLDSQVYGMGTAVRGTYSATNDVTDNIAIIPDSTAQNTSVPDAVQITVPAASTTSIPVATAPIVSGTNTPTWWTP